MMGKSIVSLVELGIVFEGLRILGILGIVVLPISGISIIDVIIYLI